MSKTSSRCPNSLSSLLLITFVSLLYIVSDKISKLYYAWYDWVVLVYLFTQNYLLSDYYVQETFLGNAYFFLLLTSPSVCPLSGVWTPTLLPSLECLDSCTTEKTHFPFISSLSKILPLTNLFFFFLTED